MHPSQTTGRARFGVATTLLLGLAVAIVTLAPVSPPTGGPEGVDKLYHLLAFAALAFPLPFTRAKWTFWVAFGVAGYGGLIEVIQPHFGRNAEWADLLADTIGAVIGAYAGRWAGQRTWRT